MKRILLIIFSLFIAVQVFGQKDADEKTTKKSKPLARLDQADRIMVDVFTDIWMNKPDDSVMSLKSINRGCNAYLMRDIPIGKSNFSFAIGAGISCHNVYSDAVPFRGTVTDATQPSGYSFVDSTVFAKLPSTIGSTEIKYKNNKLALVYVDVPIEFRFRTKNEGQKFKCAIGFKIGYKLESHTKYHGNDIRYDYATRNWVLNSDNDLKIKTSRVPNIEAYRLGPTIRIGWGYVNVSAFYSLTNLFKKGKGPEMYPLSVGLTITPF
jgi:hypothetical protein